MRRRSVVVTVEAALTVTVGLVTNAVTPSLPRPLNNPWILWPMFAVLVPGLIAAQLWLNRITRTLAAAEPARQRTEFLAQLKYFVIDQGLNWIYSTSPRMDLKISLYSQVHPQPRTVSQAFARARKLLIQGIAGAGKTVALLELARELTNKAYSDASSPIPVIFNLSSWARKQPPLEEWLINELVQIYHVPRRLAEEWIHSDKVLPLLDGLDTVRADCRIDCILAINRYLESHGPMPLVVSCRTVDYAASDVQLAVAEVVEIQSPDLEQTWAYLHETGMQDGDIAELLHVRRDEKLLATPLMLHLTSQVGWPTVRDALNTSSEPPRRQSKLFDAYVEHMFEHRSQGTRSPYKIHRDLHGRRAGPVSQPMVVWLSRLAYWLDEHDQSEFHMDRMQPDLLDAPRLWSAVMIGLWFLIGFLPIASSLVVTIALLSDSGLQGFIPTILFLACGMGLMTVLIGWFMRPDRVTRRAYLELLGDTPRRGFFWTIMPTETSRWSWHTVRDRAPLIGFLLLPLVIVVMLFLHDSILRQLAYILPLAAVTLISWGRTPGLLRHRARPNEGIQRTARRCLLSVPMIGSISLVSMTAFTGSLIAATPFATAMFVMGLLMSGYAVAQHYLLRALLAVRGDMPWRIGAFLEDATALLFLRRNGSGYAFIHPLFHDYFAHLYRCLADKARSGADIATRQDQAVMNTRLHDAALKHDPPSIT